MSENNFQYKYNEDTILEEIQRYIKSTYKQHYAGKDEIQTLDVWKSLNIDEETFRSNIIKYAMRYKYKQGQELKDLMKIIHYTILLLNRNHIEEIQSLLDKTNNSQ